MIEQLSIFFGILAGAIQLWGYWIYNRRMGPQINIGSWAIWAIGGVIDLVSFIAITDGDWVVNILPAICAAAAVVTFGYAFVRRRFGWPDRVESGFIGLDVIITGIWYLTNAVVANVLYQLSNAASFYPLVRKLRTGEEKEDPLPWAIWTCAYALLFVSVALRLKHGVEMAYPLSHFATHLIVFWIAKKKLGSAAH